MAIEYLLDTHAFLWWIHGDSQLPVGCRKLIESPVTVKYVSMVTAWEIAIKISIGKLTDPGNVEALLNEGGLIPLEISFNHIERSKSLPLHHRDPFDRMLIAQALAEKMTLISNEMVFDRYGVKRVWE